MGLLLLIFLEVDVRTASGNLNVTADSAGAGMSFTRNLYEYGEYRKVAQSYRPMRRRCVSEIKMNGT